MNRYRWLFALKSPLGCLMLRCNTGGSVLFDINRKDGRHASARFLDAVCRDDGTLHRRRTPDRHRDRRRNADDVAPARQRGAYARTASASSSILANAWMAAARITPPPLRSRSVTKRWL